jgi:hypothetical protein
VRIARLLFFASAYLLCLLTPYLAIRTALFGRLPPFEDLTFAAVLLLICIWTLPIATATA